MFSRPPHHQDALREFPKVDHLKPGAQEALQLKQRLYHTMTKVAMMIPAMMMILLPAKITLGVENENEIDSDDAAAGAAASVAASNATTACGAVKAEAAALAAAASASSSFHFSFSFPFRCLRFLTTDGSIQKDISPDAIQKDPGQDPHKLENEYPGRDQNSRGGSTPQSEAPSHKHKPSRNNRDGGGNEDPNQETSNAHKHLGPDDIQQDPGPDHGPPKNSAKKHGRDNTENDPGIPRSGGDDPGDAHEDGRSKGAGGDQDASRENHAGKPHSHSAAEVQSALQGKPDSQSANHAAADGTSQEDVPDHNSDSNVHGNPDSDQTKQKKYCVDCYHY